MLYKKKDRVKVIDAGKYSILLDRAATIIEVDKTYDFPYKLKFDDPDAEQVSEQCGGLLWSDNLIIRT